MLSTNEDTDGAADAPPSTDTDDSVAALDATGTIVLSVVVPTRNEVDGVERLLSLLSEMVTVTAEIIFVDDSDDFTPYQVRRAVEQGVGDAEVRLIHRTGRQRDGGLGSAVVEGIGRARGDYVVVMDADLQHPPAMIEVLLERLRRGDADLVVASRYLPDGELGGMSAARRRTSVACTLAARASFPRRLRAVSDPMSGFFGFRREAIDLARLHPRGFKVMLEMIVRHPELTLAEVGYRFDDRSTGRSKASAREGRRYLSQLSKLRMARPVRASKATGGYSYDIHGIITVRSDGVLPELERFRVRALATEPDISVRIADFDRRDAGTLIDLTAAGPRIRYDERSGHRGFTLALEAADVTSAEVSKLVARSPHVLYTNVVEPVLRWRLVERGYALVHAACFTVDGQAHLVTARTDTGKTTTMLKILEQGDYGFISDDLTLIDETGRVLTYPKPLTISHHTVHALNRAELGPFERLCLPLQSRLHSRNGRRMAFRLAEMGLPVATMNTLAQIIVPPPKYHVDRLVPGVRRDHSAQACHLWIIRRGEPAMVELDTSDAMEILLENCADAYGFPPYEPVERLLLGTAKDDLQLREREIIQRALAGVPTSMIDSATMSWAEDIHAQLGAEMTREPAAGTVV